jgi:hypothetical protein
MKFLTGAPGLGAELPNAIRVLKCVGVLNLESRKGNKRPWSIQNWGWSSRVQLNLSKLCPHTLNGISIRSGCADELGGSNASQSCQFCVSVDRTIVIYTDRCILALNRCIDVCALMSRHYQYSSTARDVLSLHMHFWHAANYFIMMLHKAIVVSA